MDEAGKRAKHDRPDEPAADLAFERAWARGVIERAALATESALHADGRHDAWRLFTRHVVDGLTQVAAGAEAGLAEGETKARIRLAVRRLRDAVAAELVADGVPLTEVQAETDAIVSVFGQGA